MSGNPWHSARKIDIRRLSSRWYRGRSSCRRLPTLGRFAPRHLVVGDRVDEVMVICDSGHRVHGARVLLLRCDCGSEFYRTAGRLNWCLRRNIHVRCKRCLREELGGRREVRRQRAVARVRAGGPVYTAWETDDLRREVEAALIAEFGPVRNPEAPADPFEVLFPSALPREKGPKLAEMDQLSVLRRRSRMRHDRGLAAIIDDMLLDSEESEPDTQMSLERAALSREIAERYEEEERRCNGFR